MIKIILYILLAIILIALAAAGIHHYRVALKNARTMSAYEKEKITYNNNLGKVSVVYYSLSGHTKEIADKIKELTNADIYEIQTAEKINTTPWFYLTLRNQIKKGEYPQLKEPLPALEQYDVVFVGSPVWWYTLATPLSSYLKQTDFLGKKVVPFSTQGSNAGSFLSDFAAQAKNAKIQIAAEFNNLPEKYNQAVDNKIALWLNSL